MMRQGASIRQSLDGKSGTNRIQYRGSDHSISRRPGGPFPLKLARFHPLLKQPIRRTARAF